MDRQWEEFYSEYRNFENTPKELLKFLEELKGLVPLDDIDNSDKIVIVMKGDEWEDIMQYLIATKAPIPTHIQSSPLHANIDGMVESLEQGG